MEFMISSQQILTICTLIASIWGVLKIIQEVKKPSDDLKDLIKKHDDLLKQDNERLKKLETMNQEMMLYIQKDVNQRLEEHDDLISNNQARIEASEKTSAILLKAQFAIINHNLTNNGFDKLKEARDELQNYLTEKVEHKA